MTSLATPTFRAIQQDSREHRQQNRVRNQSEQLAADESPHDRAGSHDNQKQVVAAQDDLAEASLLCDRCAILDAGAILQYEPVSDVLQNALTEQMRSRAAALNFSCSANHSSGDPFLGWRNRCVEQALESPIMFLRPAQTGGQIMSTRGVSQVVLWCLMIVGVFSPAHALTQEELVAKLQAAGYSQVRDIKSTAEGTAVKATKDGKDVSLVVDSSGQFKEHK